MGLEIRVLKDAEQVATSARALVLEALGAAQARGETASLGLSGGSTPESLYRLFAAHHDHAAFARVHVFFGDERAVPPTHESSNFRMAEAAWLGTPGMAQVAVHRLHGEAADLAGEAQRYDALLRTCLGPDPRLTVLLLGMGADGHTASIFPGTPVTRDYARWVAPVPEGAPNFPRLTLTPLALQQARLPVVMCTGAGKAPVLRQVLTGAVRVEQFPVQLVLRQHPHSILLLDQTAAAELPGTLRG